MHDNICIHRVDTDLAVSKQPAKVEKSETKV